MIMELHNSFEVSTATVIVYITTAVKLRARSGAHAQFPWPCTFLTPLNYAHGHVGGAHARVFAHAHTHNIRAVLFESETRQDAKMEVGSRFSSFQSLSSAVQQYCAANNVLLVKNNSKTVQAANKKIAKPCDYFPEKMTYSYVHYVCKHYGKGRKSRSVGLRPNQRYVF